MKVDIGVSDQPTIMLGFMNIQIIQNNMQLRIGIEGDNTVHEIQELPATSAWVMPDLHQPGGHFQSSEQSGGTMPLIFMVEPPQSLPVR